MKIRIMNKGLFARDPKLGINREWEVGEVWPEEFASKDEVPKWIGEFRVVSDNESSHAKATIVENAAPPVPGTEPKKKPAPKPKRTAAEVNKKAYKDQATATQASNNLNTKASLKDAK